MIKKTKKIVIDTNVPVTANLSTNPANIPIELAKCALECVKVIESILKNGGLVIDSKDDIYDEYRRNLSMSGQPGIGDSFLKWVHTNRWSFPDCDRVAITCNVNGYEEFPSHIDLINFDPSDKKFIAVANAHLNKPPIIEATDSKWWIWKDALKESGIEVVFLDPNYIEMKCKEKMNK